MISSLSRKILLLLGDVFLLYLALLAMVFLGFGGNFGWELVLEHLLPFSILYFCWLIIFYSFGFYELRLIRSRFYFYPKIFGAFLSCLLFGVIFFYGLPFFDISPKTNLILDILIAGGLFVFWRLGFGSLFSAHFFNRIAIVGEGAEVEALKKAIAQRPYLGYRLVPLLFQEDLFSQIQKQKIDTVVFWEESETEPNLLKALYLSLPEKVNFLDFCSAYDLICQKIPVGFIKQSGFLDNLKKEKKEFYDKAKRAIDVLLAFSLLVLSLPFWLLIALAVKFEDGGPVFYKQKRVGKAKKDFLLVKFRSMIPEAEKQGPRWADREDKRITGIGRILRKTHLDELPQLLNILKGDISLVGPRPERPEFVQQLEKELPYYYLRHIIKPGFTGWAQLKFRYARSVSDALEKLQYDLYYVKNRSLFLDIGILLKTLQLLFRKER